MVTDSTTSTKTKVTESAGDPFAKGAVGTLLVVTLFVLVLTFGPDLTGWFLTPPLGAASAGNVSPGPSATRAAGLAASYFRSPSKQQGSTSRTSKPHDAIESHVVSRALKESMSRRVNPCSDLHAYVCTGYGRSVLRGRSLLDYAARAVDVDGAFLRAIRSPQLLAKHLSLKKAAGHYRSCMHTDASDSSNIKGLAAFFNDNRLPLLADAKSGADVPDFLDKTLELHLVYDLRLFFELRLDAFVDLGEKARFIRVFPNADFEDWKRRFTMRDPSEHGRLARDVLISCGVGDSRAEKLAGRIWTLEEKLLAKPSGSDAARYNGDEVEDAWKTSLKTHSAGALMADFELDIDSNPATSFNAMRSAAGVPKSGLALYVAWQAARRLVNVSSSQGPRRQASRCLALTAAEYGHAVRAPYLLSALTVARLVEVGAMVRAISRELVVSISNSYWLPHRVRTSFEKKVRRMRWMLGTVPRLQSWSDVDKFYRHYPSATGIFGTDYLSTRRERMRRYLESLHSEDVDSRFAFVEYGPKPAYVAPNTAVLPAASLLSPLFNLQDAPEVNYGLLGSLMLQTMMHAFDDVNVLDNATWGPGRVNDFIQRFTCSERTPGSKLTTAGRGRRVASVSVGSHALFRAFRKAAGSERHSTARHKLSSRNRLFFMSRCLLFCADKHGSHKADHSCNRLAHRSAEFARAFDCHRRLRNRTRDRCDLW